MGLFFLSHVGHITGRGKTLQATVPTFNVQPVMQAADRTGERRACDTELPWDVSEAKVILESFTEESASLGKMSKQSAVNQDLKIKWAHERRGRPEALASVVEIQGSPGVGESRSKRPVEELATEGDHTGDDSRRKNWLPPVYK